MIFLLPLIGAIGGAVTTAAGTAAAAAGTVAAAAGTAATTATATQMFIAGAKAGAVVHFVARNGRNPQRRNG